jgi:hypothetical protein
VFRPGSATLPCDRPLPMHHGGRFPAQPWPRGLRTLCVWSLQVIGCGQCTVAGTGERLCEPGR